MITRRQHKALMSPSTKILKDVVQENVKLDGSPDKNAERIQSRINSAKIAPI